jgi:hypothetical protein
MTKQLEEGHRWTSQYARLRPGYSSSEPTAEPRRWYQVVDPEDLGFFIETNGALHFVSWMHFDVREEIRHHRRAASKSRSALGSGKL